MLFFVEATKCHNYFFFSFYALCNLLLCAQRILTLLKGLLGLNFSNSLFNYVNRNLSKPSLLVDRDTYINIDAQNRMIKFSNKNDFFTTQWRSAYLGKVKARLHFPFTHVLRFFDITLIEPTKVFSRKTQRIVKFTQMPGCNCMRLNDTRALLISGWVVSLSDGLLSCSNNVRK